MLKEIHTRMEDGFYKVDIVIIVNAWKDIFS